MSIAILPSTRPWLRHPAITLSSRFTNSSPPRSRKSSRRLLPANFPNRIWRHTYPSSMQSPRAIPTKLLPRPALSWLPFLSNSIGFSHEQSTCRRPADRRQTSEPLIDAETDSVPQPRAPVFASRAAQILTGLSLVLIAFNLRPIFSSASVLLPEIIEQTGLSSFGAGVLTTLPVVCLGVFAPIAPEAGTTYWCRAYTTGSPAACSPLAPLCAVSDPCLCSSLEPRLPALASATGNVLLPGLVKRDFASRTGLMTGLYTMALCAGAASAAGLTVPLQRMLGGSWSLALGAWALPAMLVALIWFPHAYFRKVRTKHAGFRVEGLWRDRLAWQVTLFMGLQSALAYCVFGWLAPILRDRGLDGVTAGIVVSVSVMTQVFTCLLVPSIAVRCKDQRLINVVLITLAVIGLLGFLIRTAVDGLALGCCSGHGTRRAHCHCHDHHRAPICRCPHCRPSFGYGAMRWLHAGCCWPTPRRPHSQCNRDPTAQRQFSSSCSVSVLPYSAGVPGAPLM